MIYYSLTGRFILFNRSEKTAKIITLTRIAFPVMVERQRLKLVRLRSTTIFLDFIKFANP